MMKKTLLLLALAASPLAAFAGEDAIAPSPRLGYGAHFGFNLGGALPRSVPSTVERIHHFDPGFGLDLGLDFSWRLGVPSSRWRLCSGLAFEGRGFYTSISARDMPVRYQNTDFAEQHYTGYQSVDQSNQALTLPLTLSYDLSTRWSLQAGGYYSHLVDRQFTARLDGDGLMDGRIYQRETILPFAIGHMQVRNELGLLLGADCRLDENWGLYGRLKLGMTRTFERSFAVMPYALFPTYLSLGINYTLRR